MRTTYSTTKPGRGDTRKICMGKFQQQLRSPSLASGGTVVTYSTDKPRASDTKLITWQKILQLSQAIKGLQSDLVSHWKLDDALYLDSAGTNHLTASGTPTLEAGKINSQSVRFNPGTLDYLYCASNVRLQATGAFSFAGWFYPISFGPATIVGKWGQAAFEYRLYQNDLGQLQPCSGQGGMTYIGPQTPVMTLNAWHFFVWTCAPYDATYRTFSLTVDNGTPQVEQIVIPTPSAAEFRMGKHITAGGLELYFNGRIENVSLWSRAITTAEATMLWNNGAGRPYPFSL